MENIVKIIRNKTGLSQYDFSRLVGVVQSAIANYEGGAEPSYRNACSLIRVAKEYKIKLSVEDLKPSR